MIDVKWSNGHVDHVDLQFVVEANKTYLLRAEEREPPRRPPKKGTPAEELAGAAAAGAIAGAAGPLIIYSSPIWLPIAIGYWIFAPAPDLPPVEHSMHVYITRDDGSAIGNGM